MRRRLAALLLCAVPAVLVPSLRAQERIWSPDDRITITSFNEVLALAYDGQRVFGATRNGLEIYDAIARRWLAPSTVEDGYPVFEQPLAIAYDRSAGGVWLTSASGNTYLWSELSGRWDVRMPGSAPADLLRPSALPSNDPAWRVLRGSLTVDPFGRRWPLTAVVPADRPGTYWAATAGANVIFADARNLSSQWLSFGTLARGVSALAIDGQGSIWFGGDGLGPRDGVTRADSSFQAWSSYDAYTGRAPRRAVHQLLAGDTTWAAAADGLYVLLPAARSWQRIEEREGLPSANVRTIVRTTRGLWVGTQRGIAVVETAGRRVIWREMAGVRINRLAERGDTVWIASAAGLWIGVAGSDGFKVLAAPGTDSRPQLRHQIASVARAGNSIAVLTSDGLRVYNDTWSDVVPEAAAFAGGRLYDLRADGTALFVLGTRGLGTWNVDTGVWQRLTVPADVPDGPIRDVVRSDRYLWVATPSGAVRMDLR